MAEAAQLSFEACRLVNEVSARGYAEFNHGIDSDEIGDLIQRYTDFTLAHRDPEYQTMDDMLPSSNDSISNWYCRRITSRSTQIIYPE